MTIQTERPPMIVQAEAAARNLTLTGDVAVDGDKRWWLTGRGHGLCWDRETGGFTFQRDVLTNGRKE